jgi:ECF transporter S component (folate family)
MQKRILKMTLCASLIVLSVVFSRFVFFVLPVTGQSRYSLGWIPIYLAGFLLGPAWGAACGGLADVIGYLINPLGGAYFPGFTISSAIAGFLPGLLFHLLRSHVPQPSQRRSSQGFALLVLIYLILLPSKIITSVLLKSLWFNLYYGISFATVLPLNALSSAIILAINGLLTWILYLIMIRQPAIRRLKE